MKPRSTLATRSLPWWRNGDRWIVIYLWVSVTIVLAGGAVIALRPAWVEAGLTRFDDRWMRRLERGEALVAAGQYERAVDYLGELEREFPATSIKHKRDIERERLLVALSDALKATGRRGRSIDALKRLAAYDPNNIANHYRLGCALRADRDTDDAQSAFENVLRIAPYHLDAARQLMEMAYEGGRFASVVETWNRFLNATRFARVTIRAGDQPVAVDMPADGTIQSIGVPLNLPAGFAGELRIEIGASESGGLANAGRSLEGAAATTRDHQPFVVIDAWLEAPRLYGRAVESPLRRTVNVPAVVFRDGQCTVSIGPVESGAARVNLQVRILVTVDAATWDIVERSHRNVLAYDALEAARARVDLQ